MTPDSVADVRSAFRGTELRLRLLLLGDGSLTPGFVRGEEPRRVVAAELRRLREAFDALGEEASRARDATERAAGLEQELLRIAAERAAASQEEEPDTFLTPAECAQALHVSVGTVYRAVRRGDIRAVRPTGEKRGALRIPASEVETLAELRARTTG